MLHTLLSPITSRFPLTPRPDVSPAVVQDDSAAAEDFARDVLVEVMRNAVERLKVAEGLNARTQVLMEIHGIMVQDGCTKDVFREMDGFLILMNVLSTIQPSHSWAVASSGDSIVHEVLEAVRLIFANLSEAMNDHKPNTKFFECSVGYECLAQSVVPLVSDAKTVEQTLGFLASLAVYNFSFSGVFILSDDCNYGTIDTQLQNAEPMFKTIRHPGALRVLHSSIARLPEPRTALLRYSIYKFLERVAHHSHRNHAVVSSLHLVGDLFEAFCSCEHRSSETEAVHNSAVPAPERHVITKLLKGLLEMGATTEEARMMFRRAIKDDDSLDIEVLEALRSGLKNRWPQHLSLEGPAALNIPEKLSKGLPTTGFTFMIWMRIEDFSFDKAQALFSFRLGPSTLFSLQMLPGGILACQSASHRDTTPFKPLTPLQSRRWTHVALVHYPHRAQNPTIRLFIDGVLNDVLNLEYPKSDGVARTGLYVIGDPSESAQMSWCVASAYMLSAPVGDDVPRFVQHLGPRYSGRFQSAELLKFLTYEASTSLNIYLFNLAQSKSMSALGSLIKSGLGLTAQSIVFNMTPCSHDVLNASGVDIGLPDQEPSQFRIEGDVVVVTNTCLDLSIWRLGGAAVPLRLVQLAKTAHSLSRALAILAGGLRNSWQNSDDMERLRGYEILADILRKKSDLINLTSFEILFEFLGLNFRTPDRSTIINTAAYRAIALDLQLWARTKPDIQGAYFQHYAMLLQQSKYKRFNSSQRLGKMNVIRKLIFAIQTDFYPLESIPWLIDTLRVVALADLTINHVFKPLVQYLAASLHADAPEGASPSSFLSRVDRGNARLKAEQVLQLFVDLLRPQPAFTTFASSLPYTSICLLLLGDHPSPAVAIEILHMVELGMLFIPSFARKFELASGWSSLRNILPHAWSSGVQSVSFLVLIGHGKDSLACVQMLPVILAALQAELDAVSGSSMPDSFMSDASPAQLAEALLVQLIDIQSSSQAFRQTFQSQTMTHAFVHAYRSFVTSVAGTTHLSQDTVRILEKLSHFALTLSLDQNVNAGQKEELLQILHSAEAILNPLTSQQTYIDPKAIMDRRRGLRRGASMRLSIHLGEKAVLKSTQKISNWRRKITITEQKRLRKTVLDLREQRRQVSALCEWAVSLTTERGLWPCPETEWKWRLDETEGPYRVRKKLEPLHEDSAPSKVGDSGPQSRKVQEPSTVETPASQAEIPPWAEQYEMAADAEERQLDDEVVEDKHRRVRHELEPADVIEAAETVARISGVDSSPGLIIFGRTHLYMLDGLVQNDDGEVVDAHDAPKKLFFVPGSIVELDGPQKAQRWTYDQVASYSEKTFLFRDVGLEIYFKDSRSLLVVFLEKSKRQTVIQRLSSLSRGSGDGSLTPVGLMRSPMVTKFSARMSARVSATLTTTFRMDELSTAQRKWQAREISNFTYLSILNQMSGRTPSDATQYPVFPWVISDYSSSSLNFDATSTFRDLTKPMGALTPARAEAAELRYTNLQSVGEPPFHYGTHFSSSMIVCHFLIRMEPFTHMFKTLQGGDWDLPDRLFSDMKRAYESAAQDVRGDVRELIPEFFTCPEFLENSANLDFGVQQNTGERIHDVKLPLWAKGDPLLFILLNRRALESDYVSRHLPAWIDLIWGCKQRDPDSLNCFHPLSYEGSIDLEKITDDLEREASVGIIHNFGQTPRKLFTTPHPDRMMHGAISLPIGSIYGVAEDYQMMTQANKPAKDLGQLVADLTIDPIGEKILPCAKGVAAVPSRPHEVLEWDAPHQPSGEMRFSIDRKVTQVIEGSFCCCAAFADTDTLVTGSTDFTVRLWKLVRGVGTTTAQIEPTHIMRGHTASVTCIAASRAWSLVVSGAEDGSASFWDLNRGVYVKSVWHGRGLEAKVNLVAIQESTGNVASCSRDELWLHTVNARAIAVLDLREGAMSPKYPPVTSLAFHEREYCPVGVLATGAPDGSITLHTWNTDKTPEGEKARWEIVPLKKLKLRAHEGESRASSPCVTALRFIGETLYHGEDTGKVFAWELPD